MFKHLIGKDHPEFSTFRQQDASEFVSHFLSCVEKQEKTTGQDPSKTFQFVLESRLQCTGCGGVRYKDLKESALSLFLPFKGDETIQFDKCLEHFFAETIGEDYNCPTCQSKKNIKTSLRMKKYPDVLVIVMKRFIIGDDYVMKKLGVFLLFISKDN